MGNPQLRSCFRWGRDPVAGNSAAGLVCVGGARAAGGEEEEDGDGPREGCHLFEGAEPPGRADEGVDACRSRSKDRNGALVCGVRKGAVVGWDTLLIYHLGGDFDGVLKWDVFCLGEFGRQA